MPNTKLINELTMKKSIIDSDIIIVEDNEDTKQSTVENLKKNFNGDSDDPNNLKFYSSAKVNEIKQSLQKELASKANHSEMHELKKSVDTIITTQSEQESKDIEIIVARDGCNTLAERLNRDKESLSSRMMKKYKRSASGTRVYLGEFHGYGDVLVDTMSSGRLVVANCNYFNIENMRGSNNYYMDYTEYGFKYTQRYIGEFTKCLTIQIPIGSLPSGTYYFSANIYNDEVTNSNGETVQFKIPTKIKVSLKYTDRSIEYKDIELKDNNSNLFYFDFISSKTLSSIELLMNEDDFIEESTLVFDNVMLSPQRLLDTYVEYGLTYYPVAGKQYIYDVRLDNCEVYFEGFDANIQIDYYNDAYDTEYIIDSLQEIQKSFYEGTDHCGLATSYGVYNFLTMDTVENKNPENCYIEESFDENYVRNGKRSMQVFFTSYDTPSSISVELEELPNDMKYITLLMYMDKYISYYMEEDAISVYLVTDNMNVYPPNNYYKKIISKSLFLQGWNAIKLIFEEFEVVGSPNKNDINHIILEFPNNVNTINKSIYINSIIFNQSIQPTILLGFNGVYDNTFEYTLPMLKSRGLPCTVFINNSNTLNNTYLDAIIMYRLDSLDIGQFGCNPDKELLLEDNNYREQYLALKNIRDYLQNNMVHSPVSYSAPYGNLRPITSKMLKDMGYHIAKTGEDSYCSFFSENDLCIPSIEINNDSDIEYIKQKIDYAISTEQVLGISTYDVTEYGDELNAKKSMFEEIIQYIQDRYETNQINVMSYKTFYERCVK